MSSKFTMPWGEEYTGATLVDMYLAELVAHAWDLAHVTGQIDRLDPSVAVAALEGARAMIKLEYRDAVEPGSSFGEEVPPPPGADDWDRLAAFMGRDPRAPLGQAGEKGGPSHIPWASEPGCLSGSAVQERPERERRTSLTTTATAIRAGRRSSIINRRRGRRRQRA